MRSMGVTQVGSGGRPNCPTAFWGLALLGRNQSNKDSTTDNTDPGAPGRISEQKRLYPWHP
jgi:hypothetical protein